MARSELEKIQVYVRVINGYDSHNNYIFGNIPLKKIDANALKNNFNADKALAIVEALDPCLSKDIYNVIKVETSSIYMD